MHPFGGTQTCARCSKSVYAAEQVMGPARKLYHKSCLTCTLCNKRLDSFSLREHDQQPYCTACHVKSFGTRDLRQANLPHRTDAGSLPPSPAKPAFPQHPAAAPAEPPRLPPRPITPEAASAPPAPSTPTHTGRSAGGLPRTVPLSPARPPPPAAPLTPARTGAATTPRALAPSLTGTRYGAVLGGSPRTPPRWAAATPECPRCGKSVFFAEQIKAVGKTYHKGCLRCSECATLLGSGRLAEKDGEPFCQSCYGKLHGPRGGGYALLGKAGG